MGFTQAVPTSGSFTYTPSASYPGYGQAAPDAYGYGYGAGGGYGVGYPSTYGGGQMLPPPVPSGGSFTSTPQFQFYPETSIGGYQSNGGYQMQPGGMSGPGGPGAGGGMNSAGLSGPPTASLSTAPQTGSGPSALKPDLKPVGTGTGSVSRPNLAKGKMAVSSKKKKKMCCC